MWQKTPNSGGSQGRTRQRVTHCRHSEKILFFFFVPLPEICNTWLVTAWSLCVEGNPTCWTWVRCSSNQCRESWSTRCCSASFGRPRPKTTPTTGRCRRPWLPPRSSTSTSTSSEDARTLVRFFTHTHTHTHTHRKQALGREDKRGFRFKFLKILFQWWSIREWRMKARWGANCTSSISIQSVRKAIDLPGISRFSRESNHR